MGSPDSKSFQVDVKVCFRYHLIDQKGWSRNINSGRSKKINSIEALRGTFPQKYWNSLMFWLQLFRRHRKVNFYVNLKVEWNFNFSNADSPMYRKYVYKDQQLWSGCHGNRVLDSHRRYTEVGHTQQVDINVVKTYLHTIYS